MSASFLTFLVLLGAATCVLSQCEPELVEKCAGNLRSLYNSQDGPVIVKSESELKTLCSHQQTALVCINNFVNRCLQEAHRNVFNNMTMGVQEFVADFCSPNSPTRKARAVFPSEMNPAAVRLQQYFLNVASSSGLGLFPGQQSFACTVYVKHLNCFNKVADDVHHCTQRLHEWNKQVEKKRAHKEETMRQACCRYESSMNCIKTVVRNGCPDEAADLFDEMIKKVTKQFYQIAECSSHSYVISECSAASGLTSIPMFVLALGALLLALLSSSSKLW